MSHSISVHVPCTEKHEMFLWAVVEQDLRISGQWSPRGYFFDKITAKRAANNRVNELGLLPAMSSWNNYGAGFTDIDEIRWWDIPHSIPDTRDFAGIVNGPIAYSGEDWNNSAYTQLVQKIWLTRSGGVVE